MNTGWTSATGFRFDHGVLIGGVPIFVHLFVRNPARTTKTKRRGGDSNSRDPRGPTGFRDRRIQPLCHLSRTGQMSQIWRRANYSRAWAAGKWRYEPLKPHKRHLLSKATLPPRRCKSEEVDDGRCKPA